MAGVRDMQRRNMPAGGLRGIRFLAANLVGLCGLVAAVTAAEPARLAASSGRPLPANGNKGKAGGFKVDHAVVPASGQQETRQRCTGCKRIACPLCRGGDSSAAAHGLEHGPCAHGLCPAHCPVRPDVFGYYETNWRRWPTATTTQATSPEAMAPAAPPRSQLPSVDEESPSVPPVFPPALPAAER